MEPDAASRMKFLSLFEGAAGPFAGCKGAASGMSKPWQ
jgi:hypothetical protein